MARRGWRACSTPGCPELVNPAQPCRKHGRPLNAGWSKDRDYKAHNAFRRAVLERDGHRCTRCGATTQLVAHHLRPGYEPSAGVTVCKQCHRDIDRNAR